MLEQSSEIFRILLANRFEEIDTFTQALRLFLADKDISDAVQFNIDFCFEEVFTNIVKYGYSDDVEHQIEVSVEVSLDYLIMRIADDGVPFNPLEAATPDLSRPVEERPIGGLGLHLVRSLAADVGYERTGDRNVLTIHLLRRAE